MSQDKIDQFLFFCVNIGAENLLKRELETFYPELTLSYSRKGFLTYKNKGVFYDFNTIKELQVTFALRVGISLGKSHPSKLTEIVENKFKELNTDLKDCIIHSFSINTNFVFDAETEFEFPINNYSAEGKLVLDLICLGEKEVWFGVHRVFKGITRYPNGSVKIDLPEIVPSVGYLKLAEIVELFALKFDHKDLWLDFGCSPGGSSFYLLSKGVKVWGVDTAKVTESVLNNKNFKYIPGSVQDLSQEELPDVDISWVHADLNINPHQAIKEVLRLVKKYNKSLKAILFTIQIVKTDYIRHIEEFEDIFYDWGFSWMLSRQIPSHKNEYILIAQRKIRN